MKAPVLPIASFKPLAISVKMDIAIKVIIFAAILTCINLVAFM